jgi:hypothetical protein
MTSKGNEVRLETINGIEIAICSCGAKARPCERKRFMKRHPLLCNKRRQFAKQLAQTVRSVSPFNYDEDYRGI